MSLFRSLLTPRFQQWLADRAKADAEVAAELQPFVGPVGPVVDHVIGLDLGQAADYSALALMEKMVPPGAEPRYAVRHLHRWPLGTPYPTIVADVTELVKRPPLDNPRLVPDQTGVGARSAKCSEPI